jgi:hypothetical protein
VKSGVQPWGRGIRLGAEWRGLNSNLQDWVRTASREFTG